MSQQREESKHLNSVHVRSFNAVGPLSHEETDVDDL